MMQSFPQPLSVEEENDYLERLEQGDRAARNILIERNLRLVAYLVKKYSNSDHSVEDLISIGTIGLIKAIDTYKQGKGVRLATYASRCVENELLMMLRSDKKKSKEVFLYDPIGSDDGEGNHIHLLDVLESVDEDVAERLEQEDRVSRLEDYLVKYLNKREQAIIRKRYGLDGKEEVTQREIAKEMGISRSYVSRIEKRALLKLRRAYDAKE